MMPYRIALAVHHSAIRNGIMRVLSRTTNLMVVGELSDGLDLLSFLNRLSPDLVILDSSMPNTAGIEIVQSIKTLSPTIKILILPNVTNKKDLLRTISVGADGYLHREDIETRISSAIETIWQGGTYISPTLLEELSEDGGTSMPGKLETFIRILDNVGKRNLKVHHRRQIKQGDCQPLVY